MYFASNVKIPKLVSAKRRVLRSDLKSFNFKLDDGSFGQKIFKLLILLSLFTYDGKITVSIKLFNSSGEKLLLWSYLGSVSFWVSSNIIYVEWCDSSRDLLLNSLFVGKFADAGVEIAS